MKKIVTSAGMIALGVMGAHVATSIAAETDSGKALPWLNASLTVRGFYDDNVATQPSDSGLKKNSFGISVSPKVGATVQSGTTSASLSYQYDMRWYENRSNSADHSHQFNGGLKHEFSENYKMDVNEQFVIAQEAELLNETGAPIAQVMRANGNNMRNTAGFNVDGKLTPLLGIRTGYKNSLYDYDEAVYAFKLNRLEHTAYLDFTFDWFQATQVYLGYQYRIIDNNGNGADPFWGLTSDVFDNTGHFFYLGARQTLASGLDVDVRAGAELTEWDNFTLLPAAVQAATDDSSVNPYAELSVTYTYAERSAARLGLRHSRGTTEFAALDQENTGVFAMVNHSFTPRINGRVIGQYQKSDFSAGSGIYSKGSGDYYSLGTELEYLIYKGVANVSTEVGYNFDRMETSNGGFSYSRNRVYLGLKASY